MRFRRTGRPETAGCVPRSPLQPRQRADRAEPRRRAAGHLRAALAGGREASGGQDSAGAHNNLGMALATKGQYVEAAAEFRAAIAAEPDLGAGAPEPGQRAVVDGTGRRGAGGVRTRGGAEPERRASHLRPRQPAARSRPLRGGRDQLRASLAADPQSAETLNNLGIALASQGNIREAVTLFERALAIKPDFPDAQRNLATARQALGSPTR